MAYEYQFITGKAFESTHMQGVVECLAGLAQLQKLEEKGVQNNNLSYIFIGNAREWHEDFVIEISAGKFFLYFHQATRQQMDMVIEALQKCFLSSSLSGVFEEL